MKIVGVTAYTTSAAHTYTVKEKLEQAAWKPGYTYRIEAQGSIGIEEQLTPEEIQEADVVVLVIDMKISGENRLKGKPVAYMSTEEAMKNTGAILQSIKEALTKKKNEGNQDYGWIKTIKD